jgi:hypothetical protein
MIELKQNAEFPRMQNDQILPRKFAALAKQHRMYPEGLGLFHVPQ